MYRQSKRTTFKSRALLFGLVPFVVGIAAGLYLRFADFVWLSVAGGFWPVVLSAISLSLLVKLVFSGFEDRSSAVAAWLTLTWTWFYVPMWLMAVEVPYSAAIVSRSGEVHLASEEARDPDFRVWFLTGRPGVRIVRHVHGKLVLSSLELDYRYARSFIASRPNGTDLEAPLRAAAGQILRQQASKPRSVRLALIEDRAVRDRVLDTICRSVVGEGLACPLKIRLAAVSAAIVSGGLWSKFLTEKEAIEERHLPTIVSLLTQTDSAVEDVDTAFALLLELSGSLAPLSDVARKSHLLDDTKFDELLRRILAWPSCGGEAVAILTSSNRLNETQRKTLRERALAEAAVATLIENAGPLHISDDEIAALSARMPEAFAIDPAVAVRALQILGERLPPAMQNVAVAEVIKGKAAHAMAALETVRFSPELRRELMGKVLAATSLQDFSSGQLSKARLLATLSPTEMQAFAAMAVKRSETSDKWLELAVEALPVRSLDERQRKSLLAGLLFKSPKAALEFASENRRYFETPTVNEITRDYTRTIRPDFCLHLSHRNKNRGIAYFSEAQLQIFRECALVK